MTDRISSLTSGYLAGDISLFPLGLDNTDSLYQATNNATTVSTQATPYNSSFIVVSDATSFPSSGLVKLGTEIIYYSTRTNTVFQGLVRGFAGSRQNPWPMGTTVNGSVMAEIHNAEKDAIIQIEADLGIQFQPVATSLNGILTAQENRFLAPQPLFRGFPIAGPPPLTVSFHNFSGGDPIRFLWDFGDGSTDVDINPIHTYLAAGTYTVQLNMITTLGAQGISTKTDYIIVDPNLGPAFFYVTPLVGTTTSTITFIDQTEGNIASRYWIFDDGTFEVESDPDVHTITHVYTISGTYEPSLLVIFADDSKKKLNLNETILIQ